MFKKGDRVRWTLGNRTDTGEVIRMGTARNEHDEKHVYVKWSDGVSAYCKVENATLLPDETAEITKEMTEESAVMFLLNLGYTISKKSG